MPARSAGCYTCRKRKIRCDETRPGCRKCATHGVPCPGYRDPAPGEIAFEDLTASTMRKVRSKPSPSSQPSPKPSGSPASTTTAVARPIKQFQFVPEPSIRRASVSSSSNNTTDDDSLLTDGDNNSVTTVARNASPGTAFFDFSPSPQAFGLSSPSMERVQIYSIFLDYYIPKHLDVDDAYYGWLNRLAWTPNLPPAVMHGMDALSLVQVGSIHQDRKLLQRAVSSYAQSVGLLARKLTHADAARDDNTITAANLLSLCEFYDEIAQMGEGWAKHTSGIEFLFAARGPESVQSDVALQMFYDALHPAMNFSFVTRKASLFARPEWRAVIARVPNIDIGAPFFDAAIRVPMVMQRYDELMATDAKNVTEIDDALALAAELYTAMKAIHDLIEREMFGVQYSLKDISEFSAFLQLCPDRTITQAYWFENFISAYFLSIMHNAIYYLREATQALQEARQAADVSWTPAEADRVQDKELDNYILAICRNMPFFTEPVCSSTGQVGLFLPLRTVALHAAARQNMKLLGWVASVRSGVFVQGMSPPIIDSFMSNRMSHVFRRKKPERRVSVEPEG